MGAPRPLALTQLSAPQLPPATVDRPRLADAVRRGLDGPVTLVCGPAGSGKTVLLASVAAGAGFAWVSLERAHDDPARLWEAVRRALAPEPGTPLAALAYAPGPAFAVALVNALVALPEPLVLVLDDVHMLRSRASLEWLGFLVLHAPPGLRLLLAGRHEPALPLHLSRVQGTLTEVRAAALAFTEAEAAELFAAHALALDGELVAGLQRRTEGWAAGLRLAALTLQRQTDPERFVAEFAGDDRVVGEYLVAEALRTEPVRRRTFLLRMSIVAERMCGELADAITGDTGGAETLEALARRNGFVVALDTQRRWYRLHRLFADMLTTIARRELAAELSVLHARAARWFAVHGELWAALEHACDGEDWAFAGELLRAHWLELSAEAVRLDTLVARLPEGTACDPAVVALTRLREARARADVAAAEAAAAQLVAEGDPWPRAARESVARLELGLTALWAGEHRRAAVELAGVAPLARAGGLGWVEAEAVAHLALLEALRAGPVAAAPRLDEARRLAAGRAVPSLDAAAGVSALFENRPCEAEQLLAAARDATLDEGLARLLADVPGAAPGYAAVAALVDQVLGQEDPRAADVALEAAVALAEATGHRSAFRALGEGGPELLRRRIRQGTAHRALVGELLSMLEERTRPPAAIAPLAEPLTERERTVLRFLPTALSAQEIASELSVTRNTVKTHLRSLYRKLGAENRAEAVERARAHGLLRG